VDSIVEALESLSLKKQVNLCELWRGPQLAIGDDLTVTVRSTKERRRFVRTIDEHLLSWFGGFQAGDVFYDIGANCGALTLAAGAMHRDRIRIVAIEPGFASFDSLARNLAQNAMLGFVIPLQVALLDRTGLQTLHYNLSTSAGTAVHAVGQPVDQDGNAFTPVEAQTIPAYALDDLIELLGLPHPTVMKIDVDGYEDPILRGARRTLERGVIRELLVEVIDHDAAGTRLASVQRLLEGYGYELEQAFRHHSSAIADQLFVLRHADVTRATTAVVDERAARKAQAKADAAAERARMQAELDDLRGSYHLSGAAKKLDLRELDPFSTIAGDVMAGGRTGMNLDRLYTLWQAVGAAPPDAPIAEIGAYLGGSSRFIADALQARGRAPRFYVCDTFAGHAHSDRDIDVLHHESGKFAAASAEAAAEYLSGFPRLELVVGDIVETSDRLADETFGFVHVDVDVYPATAFCLRFFAPRLAEGGVIVVDDYGFVTCPGVKQAADEFIAEFPQFRLWHLLTGQAKISRIATPST